MRRIFSNFIQFFISTWQELTKVSWPSRKQTIHLTIVVLLSISISMLIVALIDFGLSEVVELFIIK